MEAPLTTLQRAKAESMKMFNEDRQPTKRRESWVSFFLVPFYPFLHGKNLSTILLRVSALCSDLDRFSACLSASYPTPIVASCLAVSQTQTSEFPTSPCRPQFLGAKCTEYTVRLSGAAASYLPCTTVPKQNLNTQHILKPSATTHSL